MAMRPMWRRRVREESASAVASASRRAILAPVALLIALALVGTALFLRAQQALTGNLWGVPLDDAYIHFRFAQNLASGHGFAFNPDGAVPASTSPLWVIVLTVPALLGLPLWVVAKAYGIVALATAAVLAWRLAVRLGLAPAAALVVGALTALDGRLLWAAPSGMEVTLFTALSLGAVLALPERAEAVTDEAPARPPARRVLLLAALCGLATLARPEGYLLTAVLAVALLAHWRDQARSWARLLLAAAALYLLLVLPYVAFALLTTGRPLPTTFYAKASGLGPHTPSTAVTYLVYYILLTISGNPALLLAPLGVVVLWRRRAARASRGVLNTPRATPAWTPRATPTWTPRATSRVVFRAAPRVIALVSVLWPLALLIEQAIFSPVLYQFARYVMPLEPFLALWAVVGIERLTRRVPPGEAGDTRDRWRGALPPLALLALAALTLTRWETYYAASVRDIDDMHVALGGWVRAHIPAGAPLALNDIGAIGYLSGRPVVDIEGLVTPQFIALKHELPLSRRAADFYAAFHRLGVRYLIVFPDVYPWLVQGNGVHLRRLYSITLAHPVIVPAKTMMVYRITN